jgi:hypothetical protein
MFGSLCRESVALKQPVIAVIADRRAIGRRGGRGQRNQLGIFLELSNFLRRKVEMSALFAVFHAGSSAVRPGS